MTENPYSPPTTSALFPARQRPISIVIAVWLFGASYIAGLLNVLIKVGLPRSPAGYAGILIALLVAGGLLLAVYMRKNWARWITVGVTAFGIVTLPNSISVMTGTSDKVIYLTQGVLQLISIILLMLPTAARWYRSNDSFNPKPLRGPA